MKVKRDYPALVQEIRTRYLITVKTLARQAPCAVPTSEEGKAVSVRGMRHFCRRMKILLDYIARLERENAKLKKGKP